MDWLKEGVWEKVLGNIRTKPVYCRADAGERVRKNVLDPFTLLAVARGAGIRDEHQLVTAVIQASAMSCTSAAVGAFHNTLLAGANGWDKAHGYDLVNDCLLYTSPSPRD